MNILRSIKFSQTAVENPPNILGNMTPIQFLLYKYDKGCIFGLDNLQHSGLYRYMGWAFDFSPYMKRFLVKQYDNWQEYYAPNKTALRKSIYGRIQEILTT